MQVFTAVVDAGSFIGAAGALGQSKAAVSRHVAELEARLGVRLLHRTTRRLSLTDEGAAFHGRCKALLADVEAAEAEVTHRADRAVGLLKVNVPVSYGVLRLAPLWAEFMTGHPQVELDVTLSDRFVDLVEEGFDLAIRIGRLGASSLVSRQMASTRLVACASPAYLQAHGHPTHPQDLARHATLGYSLLADGTTWHFERSDGSEPPQAVKVSPRMWSNSGDTCRAVALAGGGIILKPCFMVGDDLVAGRLVQVLPLWQAPELGIHAVYPSRRHLSPKVRLLVDFLSQALASSP